MSVSEATKRYLNTNQAAEHTGLSPSTLAKYRMTGAGPIFVRRGNRVLYPLHRLDFWMAAGERRSTCDAPRH